MTDTIVADVALFCRFAEFNLADTASALRSPSKWQREAQAMRLLLDAGWSHEAISGALRTLTTWGEKPAQLEVVEIAATPDECTAELEERCNAQAELIGDQSALVSDLANEKARLRKAARVALQHIQQGRIESAEHLLHNLEAYCG